METQMIFCGTSLGHTGLTARDTPVLRRNLQFSPVLNFISQIFLVKSYSVTKVTEQLGTIHSWQYSASFKNIPVEHFGLDYDRTSHSSSHDRLLAAIYVILHSLLHSKFVCPWSKTTVFIYRSAVTLYAGCCIVSGTVASILQRTHCISY